MNLARGAVVKEQPVLHPFLRLLMPLLPVVVFSHLNWDVVSRVPNTYFPASHRRASPGKNLQQTGRFSPVWARHSETGFYEGAGKNGVTGKAGVPPASTAMVSGEWQIEKGLLAYRP
jgi:hypothetical protein